MVKFLFHTTLILVACVLVIFGIAYLDDRVESVQDNLVVQYTDDLRPMNCWRVQHRRVWVSSEGRVGWTVALDEHFYFFGKYGAVDIHDGDVGAARKLIGIDAEFPCREGAR